MVLLLRLILYMTKQTHISCAAGTRLHRLDIDVNQPKEIAAKEFGLRNLMSMVPKISGHECPDVRTH